MGRLNLLACCLLLLGPFGAHAAEDDRGPRGFYIGGGGGLVTGTATDGDGDDAGSFFGTGGQLRFGEEVVPRLIIGLEVGGGGGAGSDDRYDLSVGGFVLQVGWRPLSTRPGLLLLAGTGLGGGGLTAKGDDGLEGDGGGAFHQVGIMYEFAFSGGDYDGWRVAPSFRWNLVPAAGPEGAGISSFAIGLETVWYAGR
jgi:hypothetical protein